MHLRPTVLLLAALLAALATACAGGNDYDPNLAIGRISGRLTIVGPINKSFDLQIGVTAHGEDQPLRTYLVGKLADEAGGGLDGRDLYFEFDELPLGAYDVILLTRLEEREETRLYYRSRKIRLTADSPVDDGLIENVSMTGPPPWGTVSGTVMLSGANPGLTDLLLYLTNEDGHAFRYNFSVWDAGFGVLYFSVGGLATGEYRFGLTEPEYFSPIGRSDETVTITPARLDAVGLLVTGEYINIPPKGEGLFVSGVVIFDAQLPPDAQVALLAVAEGKGSIGTSPVYHILPGQLDEAHEANYVLGWLQPAEYELRVYALDFVQGDHTMLGRLRKPLLVDSEHPIQTGIVVRAETGLIPVD
jgi:hypothetical protein